MMSSNFGGAGTGLKTRVTKTSRRNLAAAAGWGVFACLLGGSPQVYALDWDANSTGAAGGGSGTWINDGVTANWFNGTSDVPWVDGTSAVFGGAAGTVVQNNTSGAISALDLTITTAGYIINPFTAGDNLAVTSGNFIINADGTINSNLTGYTNFTKMGGGNLTLGGSGLATGVLAIDSGGVTTGQNQLGASLTLGSASTSGTLTYTGATATRTGTTSLGAVGGQSINVSTLGNILTLSGVISGGAPAGTTSLNVTGPGELLLTTATNTFTGNINVDGGTLAIDNDSRLGNVANSITLQNAGTLRAFGTSAVTLNAGRVLTIGAGNSTINVDDGDVTARESLLTLGTANQLVLAGGRTLTKTGIDTLSITAANSGVAGTISVQAGQLSVTGLGTFAGAVSVASGARINVAPPSGTTTMSGQVSLAAGAVGDFGSSNVGKVALANYSDAATAQINNNWSNTNPAPNDYTGYVAVGLWFTPAAATTVNGNLSYTNGAGGRGVYGVDGANLANVTVTFNGAHDLSNASHQPKFGVVNGATAIFGASSTIDTLQSLPGNGRTLQVFGDGTGSMVFDAGFVADNTAGLTVANALRFTQASKVNMVFQNSASTPIGGLNFNLLANSPTTGADGTLTIKTNPVTWSSGGLQYAATAVRGNVDTQSDLTVTSTLTTGAGVTLTKLGTGTLTIAGTQSHGVGATLKATRGLTVLNTNAGVTAGATAGTPATANLALSAQGAPGAVATVNINADQELKSLRAFDTNPGDTIVESAIVIGAPATGSPLLGVGGSAVVRLYTGGTAAGNAPTRADIEATYFDMQLGAFAEGGITLLSAVQNGSTRNGLGMAVLNDSLLGGPGASAIWLLENIIGDTNGDFTVDGTDVGTVLAHQGTTPGTLAGEVGFATYTILEGDTNFDGVVDGTDVATVLANQGLTYNPADGAMLDSAAFANFNVSAVPEPGVLSLLAVGAGALLTRRRRNFQG